MDSVRSQKSETEEQKEEHQLSPFEEYLQMLLQMKLASAVSVKGFLHIFIYFFKSISI